MKDEDGMANSADSDQTAPEEQSDLDIHFCSDRSVRKLWIITTVDWLSMRGQQTEGNNPQSVGHAITSNLSKTKLKKDEHKVTSLKMFFQHYRKTNCLVIHV